MADVRYRFVGTCASFDAHSIHQMRDGSQPVSYRTMRRACSDLLDWAAGVGYDRHLPLSKDWHVAYFRSTFRGHACYYLVWSAYECIWLPHEVDP